MSDLKLVPVKDPLNARERKRKREREVEIQGVTCVRVRASCVCVCVRASCVRTCVHACVHVRGGITSDGVITDQSRGRGNWVSNFADIGD